MQQLLATYSLSEIIMFIVMLALAVKELITFIDWAKARIKAPFDAETEEEKEKEAISKELKEHSRQIQDLSKAQGNVENTINKMSEMIDLLIKSDKDDIKAYITKEHHYFCYELGYIDDYSLDCIEKRYDHYKDEGGNSFVETLMNEIRNLPKISPNKNTKDK